MSEEEQKLFGLEKLHVTRSSMPAITHVDYSARIQTVDGVDNPLYYKMIKKFDEKYGCPVIINTSFNVRGEPIVCTPEDAYLCFMRTNMDYLIMENYLLDKREQKSLEKDIDWQKEFELGLGGKMLLEEIKAIKSDKRDLRNFGITIGIASGILGGLLWWKGKDTYMVFTIISAVFIFFGLVVPAAFKAASEGMDGFGCYFRVVYDESYSGYVVFFRIHDYKFNFKIIIKEAVFGFKNR